MKNDPLVAKLYNKMQQEQSEYRAWLLAQPPEEILNHVYEYSSREDILIALENASLRPAQLRALLESQAPLADIYKDCRDCDTNTLDVMALCIADRADIDLMESTKKNWPPVYYQTGRYAREHEELPQYRASMKLNEECRDEIDDAISYNYNGLCLDDGAVQQVLAGYGAERTRYIVAAAIQVRDGDARISPKNRRWANPSGASNEEVLARLPADIVLATAAQCYAEVGNEEYLHQMALAVSVEVCGRLGISPPADAADRLNGLRAHIPAGEERRALEEVREMAKVFGDTICKELDLQRPRSDLQRAGER